MIKLNQGTWTVFLILFSFSANCQEATKIFANKNGDYQASAFDNIKFQKNYNNSSDIFSIIEKEKRFSKVFIIDSNKISIDYGNIVLDEIGGLAKDVVLLDLEENDRIKDFKDGYSVIEKGSEVALIDSKGHIVVPYFKYKSITGFTNGFCQMFSQQSSSSSWKLHIIDTRLKEIPIAEFRNSGVVNKEGIIYLDDSYKNLYVFYDLNKRKVYNYKKHKPNDRNSFYTPSSVNNNRVIITDNGKYGYSDLNGNIKVKPIYYFADKFSEGLAVVGIEDDFGKVKYGFIDTSGKIVIPFKYKSKPGRFYNNRATITVQDEENISLYHTGYVNKLGEIKLTIKGASILNGTVKEGNEYSNSFYSNFSEGMLIVVKENNKKQTVLIDTAGNELYLSEKSKFQGKDYYYRIGNEIRNESIQISAYGASSTVYVGLINTKGEILIPPVFIECGYFDEVSGLAKAKFLKKNGAIIEGFINKEGVFVIVKGDTVKF